MKCIVQIVSGEMEIANWQYYAVYYKLYVCSPQVQNWLAQELQLYMEGIGADCTFKSQNSKKEAVNHESST